MRFSLVPSGPPTPTCAIAIARPPSMASPLDERSSHHARAEKGPDARCRSGTTTVSQPIARTGPIQRSSRCLLLRLASDRWLSGAGPQQLGDKRARLAGRRPPRPGDNRSSCNSGASQPVGPLPLAEASRYRLLPALPNTGARRAMLRAEMGLPLGHRLALQYRSQLPTSIGSSSGWSGSWARSTGVRP